MYERRFQIFNQKVFVLWIKYNTNGDGREGRLKSGVSVL